MLEMLSAGQGLESLSSGESGVAEREGVFAGLLGLLSRRRDRFDLDMFSRGCWGISAVTSLSPKQHHHCGFPAFHPLTIPSHTGHVEWTKQRFFATCFSYMGFS